MAIFCDFFEKMTNFFDLFFEYLGEVKTLKAKIKIPFLIFGEVYVRRVSEKIIQILALF